MKTYFIDAIQHNNVIQIDALKPYLWKDEWVDEEMRIPRGVKLTSLVKAEKGEKEALKFTKIIFIPIGVLGEEGL